MLVCWFPWGSAFAAPSEPSLVFQNVRAVWEGATAHLALDCADAAEIAGRHPCGFGEICCALLPDTLEGAVDVTPPGPFVATATRNGLRIDGPFLSGAYGITVRPSVKTRHGTHLGAPYRGQVQVPPRPMVAAFLEHPSVMTLDELARVRVARGTGASMHLRVFRVPPAGLVAWRGSMNLTAITPALEPVWDTVLQGPWDGAGTMPVDLLTHVGARPVGVLVLEVTADGRRDAFFTRITSMALQAEVRGDGTIAAHVAHGGSGQPLAGVSLALHGATGESLGSAVSDATGAAHFAWKGGGRGGQALLVAATVDDSTYVRVVTRPGIGRAPSGAASTSPGVVGAASGAGAPFAVLLLGAARVRPGERVPVFVASSAPYDGGAVSGSVVVRDGSAAEVGRASLDALAPWASARAGWVTVPVAADARGGDGHVVVVSGGQVVAETRLVIESDGGGADGITTGTVRLEGVPAQVRQDETVPLVVRVQRNASLHRNIVLRCFARPGAVARVRAAGTSFNGAALAGWQFVGEMRAALDADGRASLRCPAVATVPMVGGPREVVAVAEVRGADGALVGRADGRWDAVPGRRAARDSAGGAGAIALVRDGDGSVRGTAPCAAVDLTADALWFDHAWDYARGHETWGWQPRRWRVGQGRAAVTEHGFRWDVPAAPGGVAPAAPWMLVRAACGGDEALVLWGAGSARRSCAGPGVGDTARVDPEPDRPCTGSSFEDTPHRDPETGCHADVRAAADSFFPAQPPGPWEMTAFAHGRVALSAVDLSLEGPVDAPADSVAHLVVRGSAGASVALFVSADVAPELGERRILVTLEQAFPPPRLFVAGADEGPLAADAWRYVAPLQAWEDPWLPPDVRWLGVHTSSDAPLDIPLRIPAGVGALHVHAVALTHNGPAVAHHTVRIR